MGSHVNIFDSFILGFAADSRSKRSEESWDDEFPQREAARPLMEWSGRAPAPPANRSWRGAPKARSTPLFESNPPMVKC
jgi:hypothetical protein